MKESKEAIGQVQEFLRVWFCRRDPETAEQYLSGDIYMIGTGGEIASGLVAVRGYLAHESREHPEPFRIVFLHPQEQRLKADCACVSMEFLLQNKQYSWRLRTSMVLRMENDRWRICNIHASEAAGNQRSEKHYPQTLVLENLNCQRSELLDEATNGGMMGAYHEPDFPFYYINQRMLDDLGYASESEFVSDISGSIGNCMHPDDRTEMLRQVEEQMAAKGEYTLEYRMRKKNGEYIWVHDIGHSVTAENGKPAIMSVCMDITALHMAQEERRRIRVRFQREFQYAAELAAPNLIAKGQADLTMDVFESYSGLGGSAVESYFTSTSVDEALRYIAQSAFFQEDVDRFLERFSRRHLMDANARGETDHSLEFRRRWADGRTIWCRTVARTYLTPETNHLTLFIYSFDITEEWLSRRLLERASTMDFDFLMDVDILNDHYRIAAQGAPDFANVPASGSFRDECLEVLATTIPEAFHAELFKQLNFDNIQAKLETDASYSFTVPSRADGRLQYKKFSLAYIDQITGHVCLSRMDITDIIEQEQRQREALLTALQAAEQANVAKSDFLSRMSHEIRTPLNAIIGMTTIAAGAGDNRQEVADCLHKIGVSSRFLLALINDILDMSRIESGKMLLKSAPFSLERMISSVTDMIRAQANQKGVQFECMICAGLGNSFVGDEMKLQQVLINILSNAVKFTAGGGKVAFSAACVHHAKNAATLRFVITDTGIGIAPAFLPKIFDPFMQENGGSTTAYGGTGLGLAISKNIVDMMNGHITVRSIQNVGSEFTVDVRLETGAEETRPCGESIRYAGMKVLVVDDDTAVCQNTVRILREVGVTAEGVDSSVQAFDRVRKMHENSQHFDAVILDWKMPKMDGIETARRLRTIVGREITIMIMTAYDCSGIEEEAHAAGVDLLIEKPLFRSTLESAFEQVYSGKARLETECSPKTYDFKGRRILLAEDHPLNTEIAVKLLQRVGFQVDTAENGLRVLERYRESELNYYDAVLMDIRMPLMDGLSAAAAIRNLNRPDAARTPIIAMTANAFEDDVQKSLAAGMNAHLAKPIEPEVLYRALHEFVIA